MQGASIFTSHQQQIWFTEAPTCMVIGLHVQARAKGPT